MATLVSHLRRSKLSLAILGVTTFVALGCSDTADLAADPLAQDSTLALEVLGTPADTPLTIDSADLNVGMTSPSGHLPTTPAPTSAGARTTSEAPASAASEVDVTVQVPVRKAAAQVTRRSASRPSSRMTRSSTRRADQRASATRRSRAVASTAQSTPNRSTRRAQSVPTGSLESRTSASRAWLVLAAGSELPIEASERVCTSTDHAGDEFEAVIAEDIVRATGTIIPKGARVVGETFTPSDLYRREIGIRIKSVSFDGKTYPVNSEITRAETRKIKVSRSEAAARTAAGAGIGAVVGSAAGGTGATVIGAVGGAAVGAISSARARKSERCIPRGGDIVATLTEPLRIAL